MSAHCLPARRFREFRAGGAVNFIANYEPIIDQYGDVIGAVAFGRPQASIAYLLKYFENIRIGNTGYVWAIELVGRGESVVRISRDGKRNGFIVEGDTFRERRRGDARNHSLRRRAGRKNHRARLQVGSGAQPHRPHNRLHIFQAVEPRDRVERVQERLRRGVERIDASARNFVFMLVPVGLAMLFFAGFAAWLAGVRGVQMVDGLKRVIGKIKGGDIPAAQAELAELADPRQWSNSEIFRLSLALDTMSANISKLVAKVQDAGENLAQSAAKISSGAEDIAKTTSARAERLSDILGTIDSISNSASLLNADALDAAKNIEASLEIMSDGGNLLGRLNENAAILLGAADSVSARLAVIKDKTERILAAMSTINAVSERTNMLSLNASIEAERAADANGGFAAVSAEITRLADRTAVAAMNVSRMVAEMDDSVNLGVGDMDDFAARMKSNSEMISKVHDNLASAEGQIAELGPKFESLAEDVSGQEKTRALSPRKRSRSRNLARKPARRSTLSGKPRCPFRARRRLSPQRFRASR